MIAGFEARTGSSPVIVRGLIWGPRLARADAVTLVFCFSAAGPASAVCCSSDPVLLLAAICCLGDDCTSLYNPERLFRAHKGCNSVSVTVSIIIKVVYVLIAAASNLHSTTVLAVSVIYLSVLLRSLRAAIHTDRSRVCCCCCCCCNSAAVKCNHDYCAVVLLTWFPEIATSLRVAPSNH